MLTQAPKGTRDILPGESFRWQAIELRIREIFALRGYLEIRTPVFEHTELFQRGVGDTTDVVQKEMYTFEDKGGRSITLKPEGTAGTARAVIEGRLYAGVMPVKLYYLSSPIFRYENPQSGRLREHHQFGVEVFGAADASCDAEVIALGKEVLEVNGVSGLKLAINSIGCPLCRPAYHQALRRFFTVEVGLDKLCKTCNERYERNPLRILDCKDDAGKLSGAPTIFGFLCEDCAAHFARLRGYLDALRIDHQVDPRIVRGLDYYSRTVFELISDAEQRPITECGGGRYDGLIEQLGGPGTPGIGFGMGLERVIMEQETRGTGEMAPPPYQLFIATLGEAARLAGLKLSERLRGQGIACDIDHAARSLKAQFKYANKVAAPYVTVLAEDELESGMVKLRDMADGSETETPLSDVAMTLLSIMKNGGE